MGKNRIPVRPYKKRKSLLVPLRNTDGQIMFIV